MTPAAGPARIGSPVRTPRLFTIGEVLGELRSEFPGLSHSKVRFLEDRGLVMPQRTPAGYRKFTSADVERLRLVLGLQRDHYMPLKAIAEYLDALDRGLELPELPGGRPRVPRIVPDTPEDAAAEPSRHDLRLRREELVEALDGDDALIGDLEEYGLVTAGPSGYFGGHDLEVARAVRDLAAFGIEPRHLRSFRVAADRELGLVEQVVSPLRHHRGAGSAAKAAETAREISGLFLRLHGGLVRSGLERLGE